MTIDARLEEVDASVAALEPGAVPGSYVRLTVADTGSGIPLELQDRVFEPFFTTKEAESGSGLGLSTAVGIARGHGGFMRIESEVGRGTRVSVFVPVERREAAVVAPPPRPVPVAGQGRTLLLVDDEPALLAVAGRLLEHLGFAVLTAPDGAEALRLFVEHRARIDAVITYLHIPVIDGVALAGALRRVAPGIPIAVATGRLDEPTTARFRALGVQTWLSKPFTAVDLADALRRVLP